MSKATAKTVLITGTSSGFGRDTAETLARAGHNVFASMRDSKTKNRNPAEQLRLLGIEVSVKPNDFLAEGDRVVSLGAYSGTYTKTGRSFSAAFAHVWTVRGDKLARFNMHTDTAKVLEVMRD